MAEPQRGDMGRSVDIEEVRDMRDQLLRVVETGFKGVHHRQDIANGRTAKVEETAVRLDERVEAICERLETVERDNEAFHQHRRASDPTPEPPSKSAPKDGDSRRITGWDVRVYALGAGTAFGLFKILPWLVSLAQAGKP